MLLSTVTEVLDREFRLAGMPPDSPFSFLFPEAYTAAGIPPADHFEPEFLRTFHGLMRAGRSGVVRAVRTVVFLSDEVVRRALASGPDGLLLLAHHPLDMETSGAGFHALSRASLAALEERDASVYVLHTPLDVHDRISTRHAWVRPLGLVDLAPCSPADGAFLGLTGALPTPVPFAAFLGAVARIARVPDLHFIQRRPEARRVGILPGGTDVESILEAERLGCDTVVTGTYYNLVCNEIGAAYRAAFDAVRDRLTLNLVECSHYASEAVVMEADLLYFCARELGLECAFVPQDDPWH